MLLLTALANAFKSCIRISLKQGHLVTLSFKSLNINYPFHVSVTHWERQVLYSARNRLWKLKGPNVWKIVINQEKIVIPGGNQRHSIEIRNSWFYIFFIPRNMKCLVGLTNHTLTGDSSHRSGWSKRRKGFLNHFEKGILSAPKQQERGFFQTVNRVKVI